MTDPILPPDPPPQVPVLTLTLNPALDMATDVPRMVPDEKLLVMIVDAQIFFNQN